MKKTIIIIVIIAIVLISGYFLLKGAYQSTQSIPQISNQQTTQQSPTSEPSIQQQINQPSDTIQPSQKPSASQILATPTTHNVSIQNFTFNKKSINVKKGDTVVWTNKDSAPHTVTGSNGGPASETLNNGGVYSFTFNNTGTFDYYCAIHPSMIGSVIVK